MLSSMARTLIGKLDRTKYSVVKEVRSERQPEGTWEVVDSYHDTFMQAVRQMDELPKSKPPQIVVGLRIVFPDTNGA